MPHDTRQLPDLLATQLGAFRLCRKGNRLLLAVSGGADSMALLHCMARLAKESGVVLQIAHLDHGIRSAAPADKDLVEETCQHYGLPYTCGKVDVPAAAQASGLSIEMQARELRYAFFCDLYQNWQADALLTAHNRNDQAETILLNLSRGCSPGALAGIQMDTLRLGMRIVRPMLTIDRAKILGYLRAYNYIWNEDASNQDTHYRRNAIRHEILPALREYLNPNVDVALLRCAAMAHEDETLLQSLARDTAAAVHPSDAPQEMLLHPFQDSPAPLRRRVLTRWLYQQGQLRQTDVCQDIIRQIDQLAMQGRSGSQIILPRNQRIRHVYDRLLLETIEATIAREDSYPLQAPGTTQIPALGCQIEICEAAGYAIHPTQQPGALPATCHIRRPQNGETLFVRTRREGDRIHLLGSSGHSKLQDILTDAKIPALNRDQIPLLATQAGLVWIPGLRIAEDWSVPAPQSPSLHIQIMQACPWATR